MGERGEMSGREKWVKREIIKERKRGKWMKMEGVDE